MLKIETNKVIEYLEERLQQVEKDIEELNNRKIWVIDETQRQWDELWGRKNELEENLNHFKDLCGKKYKLLWYIDENKKHHHIIFNTKEEMIGFIKEENLFLDELKQINKEDNVWCCFDFKELMQDE